MRRTGPTRFRDPLFEDAVVEHGVAHGDRQHLVRLEADGVVEVGFVLVDARSSNVRGRRCGWTSDPDADGGHGSEAGFGEGCVARGRAPRRHEPRRRPRCRARSGVRVIRVLVPAVVLLDDRGRELWSTDLETDGCRPRRRLPPYVFPLRGRLLPKSSRLCSGTLETPPLPWPVASNAPARWSGRRPLGGVAVCVSAAKKVSVAAISMSAKRSSSDSISNSSVSAVADCLAEEAAAPAERSRSSRFRRGSRRLPTLRSSRSSRTTTSSQTSRSPPPTPSLPPSTQTATSPKRQSSRPSSWSRCPSSTQPARFPAASRVCRCTSGSSSARSRPRRGRAVAAATVARVRRSSVSRSVPHSSPPRSSRNTTEGTTARARAHPARARHRGRRRGS